ncbi:hypothetical protein ACSNN7_02495 [Micromonospora sp. URMC 105]
MSRAQIGDPGALLVGGEIVGTWRARQSGRSGLDRARRRRYDWPAGRPP